MAGSRPRVTPGRDGVGDYTRALARARPDAILPARTVGEMMATLAALPGGGVSWAQVVAYDEGLQARGLFEAADVQQLLVYQQRAAGARPAPR